MVQSKSKQMQEQKNGNFDTSWSHDLCLQTIYFLYREHQIECLIAILAWNMFRSPYPSLFDFFVILIAIRFVHPAKLRSTLRVLLLWRRGGRRENKIWASACLALKSCWLLAWEGIRILKNTFIYLGMKLRIDPL